MEALFLALVFQRFLSADGSIERVIVIGIDGAGSTHNSKFSPNIVAFLHSGAYCDHALVQYPSNSAQNWGSILNGVVSSRHELTYTKVVKEHYSETSDYPTIFKIIHHAAPTLKMASLVSWKPINTGLIELSVLVYKFQAEDDELVPYIVNDFLPNNASRTKFLFIQLSDVDYVGHRHGFKSPEYYAQYAKTDSYFGSIIKTLRDTGLKRSSLIFLTADHGGINKSHGGNSTAEMHVLWGMVGPGISKQRFQPEEVSNIDIAATALNALGIRVPQYFDSQVVRPVQANYDIIIYLPVVLLGVFFVFVCILIWLIKWNQKSRKKEIKALED